MNEKPKKARPSFEELGEQDKKDAIRRRIGHYGSLLAIAAGGLGALHFATNAIDHETDSINRVPVSVESTQDAPATTQTDLQVRIDDLNAAHHSGNPQESGVANNPGSVSEIPESVRALLHDQALIDATVRDHGSSIKQTEQDIVDHGAVSPETPGDAK